MRMLTNGVSVGGGKWDGPRSPYHAMWGVAEIAREYKPGDRIAKWILTAFFQIFKGLLWKIEWQYYQHVRNAMLDSGADFGVSHSNQ